MSTNASGPKRQKATGGSSDPIVLGDSPFKDYVDTCKENASQATAGCAKPEDAGRRAEAERVVEAEAKRHAEAERKREEALLRQLECPVCMSTMRPPIRQCSNGHTLCDTCSKKAECARCPVCRAEPTNIRNLSLEQTAAQLRVPCSHIGCTVCVPYSELVQHADTCMKRPLECPIADCKHMLNEVTPDALVAHLRSQHGAIDLPTPVFRTTAKKSERLLPKLSWAPGLHAAHGSHFVLFVRTEGETYGVWAYGIGTAAFDIEMSAKGHGRALSFRKPIEDILQLRRDFGVCIEAFHVGRQLAHWLSGTFSKEDQELKIEFAIHRR